MGIFSKNNPNYYITKVGKLFFPVLKKNNERQGPTTGFTSKEVCQHWINTQGDR